MKQKRPILRQYGGTPGLETISLLLRRGIHIIYKGIVCGCFDRIANFSLACNRISEILQDYYDLPKAIDAEKSGV